MYGKKTRRIEQLERLASSRAERLDAAKAFVEMLTGQRDRYMRRHDDLMAVVAMHLTARTSHDQLRNALIANESGAELEYALLDLAPNEQPKREATA